MDKAHFVNDEQAKDEAHHPTRGGEEAVHRGEAVPGHRERHGDRGRNQHHAGNGTDPEDQQVRDREGRNANRGEYEESNRSGTSEAVNDTNHERAKHLIKSDAAKRAVHPAEGRCRVAVAVFCSGRMRMPTLSLVGMRMIVAAGKIAGDPLHHAGKIQDA